MKYLLFLDESGDHSLSNINHDFPIFVLSGILFSEDNYKKVCDKINIFKKKYFNTTSVILHSREIRKCEGLFKILFDLNVRKKFYFDLDKIFPNK